MEFALTDEQKMLDQSLREGQVAVRGHDDAPAEDLLHVDGGAVLQHVGVGDQHHGVLAQVADVLARLQLDAAVDDQFGGADVDVVA